MMKKLILILIAMLMVSPIIACSNGEKAINLVDLVPKKARVVFHINLSQGLQDQALTGIYDSMPKDVDSPATVAAALGKVEQQIGINLRDIDEVLMFTGASGLTNEMPIGFIVAGSFERNKIISTFEAATNSEWSNAEQYRGYDLFKHENSEFAVAFLNDSLFVVGGRIVVKDVIDVQEGNEPRLGGDILNAYKDLDETLVKITGEAQYFSFLSAMSQFIEVVPTGSEIDWSPFADVEYGGLALAKEGQSISLKANFYFSNNESAKSAKDIMSQIKSSPQIIKFSADTSEEIRTLIPTLLDKLEMETSGSVLSLSITMSLSEIQDLITRITPQVNESSNERAFQTDLQTIQLAASTFYSDVHSGWKDINGNDNANNPATYRDNVWGRSVNDTQDGHYYPTAIANVNGHVLTLSTTRFDSSNPENPLLKGASALPATDAEIQAHAIWMGLLVNENGTHTSLSGTTNHGDVSVLEADTGLYLQNIPRSSSWGESALGANDEGNGNKPPGGSYTWVVGKNGNVFGAYKGGDGYWYAGYNGTYP